MQNHAGGRRRIIIPQEDQYISQVAKRNRNATFSQISAGIAITIGTQVSARTNSLRLNQVCMHESLYDPYPFNQTIVEKD